MRGKELLHAGTVTETGLLVKILHPLAPFADYAILTGTMPFAVKLIITNLIIIGCAQLGRKAPSLAGLIATMPITTLAVLLWLNADQPENPRLMVEYTRGVLWGIVPTILFFGTALLCFRRGQPLTEALTAGSAAWLAAALLHQWLTR